MLRMVPLPRWGRRGSVAAVGIVLSIITTALAADSGPPLRAMRWVAHDADPVRVFATAPAECLRRPPEPDAARSVEVGRAAFRTPVLLGGQAARAGLTCESCHRSGRDNPDFQFPGASGAPGTADVTLSLFSSHRGNGVFDPKPIPDLSGPREKLKVAPPDLPRFIHGLIVEEFDGPEPPAAVLEGLAAYVRTLEPAACPREPRAPVTPDTLLSDARRALAAARAELARGDRPTAVVMIASARARLGLIDERYAALPAEQARLRAADSGLADLQAAVRAGRPDADARLSRWLEESRELEAALRARASRSLFNPVRLSQAANRRLPARAS
jgi:hypothetical protein